MLQIELMGQLLFNLTCLEDHDELKKNLAPDNDCSSTVVSGGEYELSLYLTTVQWAVYSCACEMA